MEEARRALDAACDRAALSRAAMEATRDKFMADTAMVREMNALYVELSLHVHGGRPAPVPLLARYGLHLRSLNPEQALGFRDLLLGEEAKGSAIAGEVLDALAMDAGWMDLTWGTQRWAEG